MNEPTLVKRIIVGISGASGIIYGVRLLEALNTLDIETHLVITQMGQLTRAYETPYSQADLKDLASVYHPWRDLTASIASGSFPTMGMVVAPCSMKTLAEIAHGLGGHLLSRAADVVLKERRRLVLMVREAPLNLAHLQNMVQVTQMGGIIFPPVPAFYHHPQSIDEIIEDQIGRVLDLFGIENDLAKRWE
ncbi:MAG: aromatic acid decarboxylase [Legionellales bacterium RIFCSPHIGHO2_12_FULL_37_14]|nr:MAG: aromatic acid decarboxylase [Legionellales bacterium RIFCSPHIGHO2_12_FULL_37_14]